MHIFHNHENIKTCIFTAVKIQDLIFSREGNCKIGTTFFYFLNTNGSNSLWHTCFFSKQLLVFPINKKSDSLRSLIKERAFIFCLSQLENQNKS